MTQHAEAEQDERPDRNPGSGDTGSSVNTHVHLPPNFSAFETPEQAALLAAAQGVSVLGTANFYDFGVYRRFAAAAAGAGVMPLFGLEVIALASELSGILINDPSNPGRMYLCGKALTRFDPPSPSAATRMAAIRAAGDERMRSMAARLSERFARAGLDGGMSDVSIARQVAERCGVPVEWVSLQERHVAQAFQERLFQAVAPPERVAVLSRLWSGAAAVDATDEVAVQEAIRSNLLKVGKPAFVAEAEVSFDDAYRLILELGGIPCYPTLADGASPICAFEDPPEALARALLDRAVYCAELIPGRNRPEVVDRYVSALRGAGIIVMAGTEHNTQRMIPVTPSGLGGAELSVEAQGAFWEGTCVVAAHQELVSSGRPGYVDGEGRPSAGFADSEERIRWFAKAGAQVIAASSAARLQS